MCDLVHTKELRVSEEWDTSGELRDTGSPLVAAIIRFVIPGRVFRPISARLTRCGRRDFPPRPFWDGASHHNLTCRGGVLRVVLSITAFT